MGGNNEFDKTDIEYCTYYYFDGMISVDDFNPTNIKVDKNHIKILSFTTLDMTL